MAAAKLRLVKVRDDGTVRVDIPRELLVALELGLTNRLEETYGALLRARREGSGERAERLANEVKRIETLRDDWRELQLDVLAVSDGKS